MALLGITLGGLISIAGWIQVHNADSGKVNVAADQHAALWILSITYTWMTLVSVVGLVGSIGRFKSCITFYAYTVAVETLLIIAAGVYFLHTLFHQRGASDVKNCVGNTTGDIGDVKEWVCQKGFDVLRIVAVVIFVIVWIFQLVGIFIVFDYRGQLREETELEDEEARKTQPTWMVTGATPGPSMPTTYNAAPYDPPLPSPWASKSSPYAFTTSHAQSSGGDS